MEKDSTVSLDQENSIEHFYYQKTSQIMCQLDYDLHVLSQAAWTPEQRRQLERLQLSLDQLQLISSNQLVREPDYVPGRGEFCLTGLLAAAEHSWPDLLAAKKLRYDLERGLPLYLGGDALLLRLLWRNLLSLAAQDPRSGWLLSLRAAPEPDGRILLKLGLTSSERTAAPSESAFWSGYLKQCCHDLAFLHEGAFKMDADGYQLSLRLDSKVRQPLNDQICQDPRIRQLRQGRILLLSPKPFGRLHLARLLDSLSLRVDLCESVLLACGMIDQAKATADPYTLCIADWQGALFLELAQTLAKKPDPVQPRLLLSLRPADWPLLPLDYLADLLAQPIAYLEQPCSLSQLLDALRQTNLLYRPSRTKAAPENLIDPELGLARTGGSLPAWQNILLRLENELPLLQRGIEHEDPVIYRPALQQLAETAHFIGARSLRQQCCRIEKMIGQSEPESQIREQRRWLLLQLKDLPAAVRQICRGRSRLCQLPDLPPEKSMLDSLHWYHVLRQIEHACRCHNRRLAETAIGAAYGQRMRHSWQQALELMLRILSDYEFSRIRRICELLQDENEETQISYDDLLRAADLALPEENDDGADPVSSQYT